MKRSRATEILEHILMDMLDEGFFGMTECEGRQFLTLKGNAGDRLLSSIEIDIGMSPPDFFSTEYIGAVVREKWEEE